MRSFEKRKEELEQRLDSLLDRQSRIDRDLRRLRNPDSEERAQEAENDEVLSGLEERDLEEIGQIRRAMARIDDGSYGRCEACEGEIASDRLEAMPFSVRCVGCAS